MKATVLILVVFFTAISGNSQTDLLALNTEETSFETLIPKSKVLNSNYFYKVFDNSMAIHVSALEKRVSRFDVTSVPEYNGKSKPFEVKFKTGKGFIKVLYDKDGRILKTEEKFKDVKLPNVVRDNIFKKYINCTLLGSNYLVYYNGQTVKKIYRVTVSKDGSKKKIKINANGDFI